jgi:hypothetical protein
MRLTPSFIAGAVLLGSAPFDASAQRSNRAPAALRGQTLIARTPQGCAPIAPGCRIETGFTTDGMLSGCDSVVCPIR